MDNAFLKIEIFPKRKSTIIKKVIDDAQIKDEMPPAIQSFDHSCNTSAAIPITPIIRMNRALGSYSKDVILYLHYLGNDLVVEIVNRHASVNHN